MFSLNKLLFLLCSESLIIERCLRAISLFNDKLLWPSNRLKDNTKHKRSKDFRKQTFAFYFFAQDFTFFFFKTISALLFLAIGLHSISTEDSLADKTAHLRPEIEFSCNFPGVFSLFSEPTTEILQMLNRPAYNSNEEWGRKEKYKNTWAVRY